MRTTSVGGHEHTVNVSHVIGVVGVLFFLFERTLLCGPVIHGLLQITRQDFHETVGIRVVVDGAVSNKLESLQQKWHKPMVRTEHRCHYVLHSNNSPVHEGSLSTVYDDGKIIEVHSVQSTMMGRSQHVGGL